MGKKLRVGLVYGGRSAEHPISIRSARSVYAALDRARYEVRLVAIDRHGRWFASEENELAGCGESAGGRAESEVVPVPGATTGTCRLLRLADATAPAVELDVVFPILHGPFGEDGTIQGLLEMIGVPYVGAGVLGSAIGMDKDVQKRLLRDAGVPIVPFEVVREGEWRAAPDEVHRRIAPLGSTVFVKPANLGSSVGINRATTPAATGAAIDEALRYDRKVLVERAIDAREIECAVLGNDDPQASLPGEIAPGEAFYSYDDKYSAGSKARLLIPAPLQRRAGRRSAQAGGAGVSRSRAARHGARRLLPRARQRPSLLERAEHDPGLHLDQHVPEDVGSLGPILSGADEALDRPRPRSRPLAGGAY